MIHTKFQLANNRKLAARYLDALMQTPGTLHPQLRKAQRDALKSVLDELIDEIHAYQDRAPTE